MVLYRIIFVVSLFLLLSTKETQLLLFFLLTLYTFSYKQFFILNKKVIKSLLLFNLGVSIGYFILSSLKGMNPYPFLLYINLKVFTLSYFVFLFFSTINVVKFFSFSKDLSFLLMISLSQIISYKKTYEDFKLAYKARVIQKIYTREKSFLLKVFEFFLTKALKDSKERTMAMKARGFF